MIASAYIYMPANRRVTRYHLEDDTDSGITRSKLSKLGRKRQLDYMRAWFGKYYTDPVHEMPWMEGEYHFPYGGPYNAFDELYDEFSGIVPEERIRELAEDVEGEDGTYDWAPTNGIMRKRVAYTPLLPDRHPRDCRSPALDTSTRIGAGECRRGRECGFAAAGGHRAGSTASAGAWRSAC